MSAATDRETSDREKLAFIEEVGLTVEAQGLPRMAGRILGALLVADPPEQSAEALAGTLRASRGSISTMTRLLERGGLIDRVAKAGERRTFYRNRPDGWAQAMRQKTTAFASMGGLATKGLRLIADAPPEVRRGLEDMRAFYTFWEREMPAVLERWSRDATRAERRARETETR